MDNNEEIKHKIDEEVEKRLQQQLDTIKSQIRLEVEKEYEITSKEPEKTLETKVEKVDTEEYFERFTLNIRLQHIALLSTTLTLILTGIPLKFPQNGLSQFVMSLFGGPPGARSVHHLAAMGMILTGLFHLFYTFWFEDGRKNFYEFLPRIKDFKDLIQQLKFFLGFTKEKPKFGRFSYIEKFDYWAVYWGLIMMIGTGTIMWLFQAKFTPLFIGEIDLSFGPDIVTKTVYDIAREMHSDEALLATLVIIGWHFYNTHLNPHKFPMNKVWLTGKISKKEMLEEHPLEYEELIKQKKSNSE